MPRLRELPILLPKELLGHGRIVILPGQYFDEETGLAYNYFRDYDSVTGRYVESDPVGLTGGSNAFLYASANPLRYYDPLGLWRLPDFFSFSIPTSFKVLGFPITVDACGQVYVGIGVGFGRPSVGFAAGWVVQPGSILQHSGPPTGSQLRSLLGGLGGTYGFGIGTQFNAPANSDRNLTAALATTPGFGVSYSVRIGQIPGWMRNEDDVDTTDACKDAGRCAR